MANLQCVAMGQGLGELPTLVGPQQQSVDNDASKEVERHWRHQIPLNDTDKLNEAFL